jgi:hypothetical protein
VTTIGDKAFYNCANLILITFNGNLPLTASASAFPTSNASLICYYLPENASTWEAAITDGKWNGMTI